MVRAPLEYSKTRKLTMRNRPVNLQKLGEWILRRMLLYEEQEEKLGDFEESFQYLDEKSGSKRAKFWYW